MKGNHIFSLLVFAVTLMPALSFCQQEPLYTQYMLNIGSFNPAYAASLEDPELTFTYRAQWVGLDGAPATFRVGYSKPFDNERNGLGVNISRDEIGPSTQTFFDIAYSYQIRLGATSYLSMGIDGGGSMLNIDFTKGNFQAQGEPLLSQTDTSNFYPTVGAGVFLYDEQWYAGVSVPNFLAANFYDEEIRSLTPEQLQFDLIAGYVYTAPNEMFRFKPAVLASYTKGLPLYVNVSANTLISETVMLGLSYQVENAISGLAGIHVSPTLFVGYSYDYNTNNLGEFSGASHEVVLKWYSGRQASRARRPRRDAQNGKPKRVDSPRFF